MVEGGVLLVAMRLDKSKLSDAYKHIKFRARANGSPILICVANDCDAIAANHIFTVRAVPSGGWIACLKGAESEVCVCDVACLLFI